MNISITEKTEQQLKTEAALAAKGHNVTVLWDVKISYRSSNGQTRACVDTVCRVCGTHNEKKVSGLKHGEYSCSTCKVNDAKKLNTTQLAIDKAEAALTKRGHSVTVLWNEAVRRDGVTYVRTICNVCKADGEKEPTSLRKGKYSCNCIKFKLGDLRRNQIVTNIAKHNDVDITVDFTNGFYRDYHPWLNVHCDICGHDDSRSAEGLATQKYHCIGCTKNQYAVYCAAMGREYISHGYYDPAAPKKSVIKSNCTQCGSERLSSANIVHSHTPVGIHQCEECRLVRIKRLVEDSGYEFVGIQKGRNGRVMYRCAHDGHEMKSAPRVFEQSPPKRCPMCSERDYKEAVEAKGCTFVRTIKEKGKSIRVEYITRDGVTLQRDSGAISAGSFLATKDSNWNNPHETYLIKIEHEGIIYCKIGVAYCVDARIKHLKLSGDVRGFVLEQAKTRYSATALETALHKEFEDFKLPTTACEVFTGRLVAKKRKSNGERYFMYDGNTEWFTHEVYDILKHRYKLEE